MSGELRGKSHRIYAVMHDGQMVKVGVERARPGYVRIAWSHANGAGRLELDDAAAAYIAAALAVTAGVMFAGGDG